MALWNDLAFYSQTVTRKWLNQLQTAFSAKFVGLNGLNKTLIAMKRNFRISFIKFIWDKMQCYATDIFIVQYTLELITEFLPNGLEWKAPGY